MKNLVSIFLCVTLLATVISAAAIGSVPNSDIADEVDNAVQSVVDWYSNYESDFVEWDVIALSSLGVNDKRFEKVTSDSAWAANAKELIDSCSYSKLSLSILALLASGKSPDAVCGTFPKLPSDVIASIQNDDLSLIHI